MLEKIQPNAKASCRPIFVFMSAKERKLACVENDTNTMSTWFVGIVIVAVVLLITLWVAFYDYEKDKLPADLRPQSLIDVVKNLQPSAPDNGKIYTNTEIKFNREQQLYAVSPQFQSIPTSVRLVTEATAKTHGIYRARPGIFEANVRLYMSVIKNVKLLRVSLVPFHYSGPTGTQSSPAPSYSNSVLLPITNLQPSGSVTNQVFNVKLTLQLTNDIDVSSGIMVLVEQLETASKSGPSSFEISGKQSSVLMQFFTRTSYDAYYQSNRLAQTPTRGSAPLAEARAILAKKYGEDFV